VQIPLARAVNREADVIAALERVPHTAWQDDHLVFSVGHEPLYLLDAAHPASRSAPRANTPPEVLAL
jgi:hypothetical protein